MNKRLLPLLLAACYGAAHAGPTAPTVVNGQATFTQQGNVFTITNTPGAIINWKSFSVEAGEVTRFVQQDASSAVLNRITGQDPTRILGSLESNGRVYLINPNGVMFGQGSRVDVAGLVASTLSITDEDFIAGRDRFAAKGAPGDIVNQGSISTGNGGKVFLLGANVENSGVITSAQGDVVLAAGREVQLVESGDPDLHVVVSAPTDKAVNIGRVLASGGRIGIYGALLTQRGEVNADSAMINEQGKIVLRASREASLEAGSVTTSTGIGGGGAVKISGKDISLKGDALVDVSGATGGGSVKVGSEENGQGKAEKVSLDSGVRIKADATHAGNGGNVVVLATVEAQVLGSVTARGGKVAGNGGAIATAAPRIEVGGLETDTGATNGQKGVALIDVAKQKAAKDTVAAVVNAGRGAERAATATASADERQAEVAERIAAVTPTETGVTKNDVPAKNYCN